MAEDPYTGPYIVRGKRRYKPRHLSNYTPRDSSYVLAHVWEPLKYRLIATPSIAALFAGLVVGQRLFS